MNDSDIQAAATILGSMIVSGHPKVSNRQTASLARNAKPLKPRQ